MRDSLVAAVAVLLPLAALLAWSRWRRDDSTSAALDKVADRVSQSAVDKMATTLAARLRPAGALESFVWLMILAGLGIGGAAKLQSWRAGENIGPTQPGWPSGGQPTTTPGPSKPNTPSVSVTVIDSSTLYVDFSAFVGNQGDTQDSIAVTTLALSTADTLNHAKSGVQSRDTIVDNTDFDLGDTVRVLGRQKGTNGGWSDADTVQVIITLFAANAPAGLSTLIDYEFGDVFSGNGAIGSSGITATDWDGNPSGHCATAVDASSVGGGRVWVSQFQVGESGTGPCRLTMSLTTPRDTVYVAQLVKYSSGWEENTTSQKAVYFDSIAGSYYGLFEYAYRAEAVLNVTSATGCTKLESSSATSVPVKSPPESSPCQNQRATYITAGSWDHYEFLWVCGNGSGVVKWWKNGELRGSHTGRIVRCPSQVVLADTWGGGGYLTQTQDRRYDRVQVRVSAN